MTIAEIDQLEAGRDLDALIDLHIFGGEYHKQGTCGHTGCYRCAGSRPRYSTDLNAAWKIVESIPCECAHKFSLECEHGVWLASISGLYEAEAETAILAICRAALKTIQKPAA